MSEGISQSRFYMWRAVFAIAHVDGEIDKREEGFMDNYLKTVPFSLKQKAILEDDVIHPKDPAEMLAQVSDPHDQGLFFQFARMMVWSDGNYDVQEREIMQRLLGAHMEKLDIDSLAGPLRESREGAAKLKEEESRLTRSAKGGIGPIIARWFDFDRGRRRGGREISESRFYMWRTIFAMAHADHKITDKERAFMLNVLEKENFSRDQRVLLELDIDKPQDPMDMFMSIAEQEDRSLFFYYARMLCWCDGNFDEQEQEIMLRLKRVHVRNVDFEKVMQDVDFELADDHKAMIEEDMRDDGNVLVKFLQRWKA